MRVDDPDAPAASTSALEPGGGSRASGSETERAVRARADILSVATEEFAAKGLTGARVDEIAARTRTTKRMIYYYFGSKDGLFRAALEGAYGRVRRMEQTVQVDRLPPPEALRALAFSTFDHHTAHPEFVRLVGVANIHAARHLRESAAILHENGAAITVLDGVIHRGVARGDFRRDVDAIDVHMLISAFACFQVANRHTFAAIFGRDMMDHRTRADHRRLLGQMVLATMAPVSRIDDTPR